MQTNSSEDNVQTEEDSHAGYSGDLMDTNEANAIPDSEYFLPMINNANSCFANSVCQSLLGLGQKLVTAKFYF